FGITVTGRGAHAAMPHLGADPIMAAVQIAQSLQTIISRNKNPLDTAVLSITQFHAGSADNVVPTEARLRGTVRTFATAPLDLIEQRMREIAQSTATAFDMTAEVEFKRNYPPTINDPTAAALSAAVLRDMVGEARVNANITPS